MTFVVLLILVFLSLPLTLASPLPRDLPFFVVFGGFWLIPRSQSMMLVVIAGLLVDLFSPVKGLAALSYPLALLLVAYCERTLLVQRSLFVFLILALSAWVCVEVVRIVLSGAFMAIFTATTAVAYGKAALLNILFFIMLYGALKALTPRHL